MRFVETASYSMRCALKKNKIKQSFHARSVFGAHEVALSMNERSIAFLPLELLICCSSLSLKVLIARDT